MLADGAVLRTKATFTRSIGPGLVFTGRGEYLAGATDLHRRLWPNPPLGPRGEDEDPFADWDERGEAVEAFQERQKRRMETAALTRDGVEIVPNISAVSCLDPDLEPRWGRVSPLYRESRWTKFYGDETESNFGYNPESVRLAITGEAIDPNVSEIDPGYRYTPWFQLPVFLAVDLWREYLRKFTFEELFNPLDAYGGKTALQVTRDKILERLTKYWVDEIDPVGKPITRQVESHEYVVLKERGIEVLHVPIRNLHFPRKVDQQLEDKWFSYWLWRAEDEREYVNRLRSYRAHGGAQDALRNFAYNAVRNFDPRFLSSPKPRDKDNKRKQLLDTLERMLRGTLAQCVKDSYLHDRLAGEETQLAEIIDWLRGQR